MKKAIWLTSFVFVIVALTPQVSQAGEPTITITANGSTTKSNNTAPVFDPISTRQLAVFDGFDYPDYTAMVVGATDREGHPMELNCSGLNIANVEITSNNPGRIEAIGVRNFSKVDT